MKKYCILLILIMIGCSTFAQSKKKKNKKEDIPTAQQPSSVSPYYPTEEYEPKKKRKRSKKGRITYEARANFYKRMEEVAKAERKAEREAKKPENSDPLYFGHKRPPKKRSPKKMKYCKVCGIRH